MSISSKRLSRRTLLRGTFAAGLGTGIVAALGAVASFLYPSGRGRTRVRLGSLRSFAVGSKTLYTVVEGDYGIDAIRAGEGTAYQYPTTSRRDSSIWLVRLEEGLLALSAKCPHLHCTVPWRPNFKFADPATGSEKTGWFRCPCHGSTFNDAGVRVYGPAPRSLDRYDVHIEGSGVYLDVDQVHKGTNDNAKFAADVESRTT